MKYKVIWSQGIAKRTAPHTGTSVQSTYTGLTAPLGAVLEVLQENIPDGNDPANLNKSWVKLAETMPDGRPLYAASDYPDSAGVPRLRMVKEDTPAPAKVVKAILYDEAGNVVDTLVPQVPQ